MEIVLARNNMLYEGAKLLSEEYFSSLANAAAYLKKKIARRECFLAVDKSKVVGLLVYSRDYSHDANYVEYLLVLGSHRREGIANNLLRKYIEVSRKEQPKKQKYALSSAVSSNAASIKMHKKFGFVELGRVKKLHYGSDEIIFGYKLR